MKIFSMLLTATAFVSVALVFLLVLANRMPGPLHPIHERVPGIELCESCHSDTTSMDEACLVCHEIIRERKAMGRGLHADDRPCTECHSEHFGDQPALLSHASFVLAGIEDETDYDHQNLKLRLTGRHWDLPCIECHENARARLLPPGGKRFLGASDDCLSCHRDVHEGKFGQLCELCHDQDKGFDAAEGRAHDRFPLTGSHSKVLCNECHSTSGPHSVAASLVSPPTPRTCQDCHDSPHGIGGEAVYVAEASDCARCHDATQFEMPYGVPEHDAHGIDLRGAHEELDCAECHYPERAPLNTIDRCVVCHEPPHTLLAGTRERGPDEPPASKVVFSDHEVCLTCHQRDAFVPVLITVDRHSRFEVSLEGKHLELTCEQCHGRERGLPVPVLDDCAGCHESFHTEPFLDGDSCAECHVQEGFDVTELSPERHLASGFSLALPHDEVECADCHQALEPRTVEPLVTPAARRAESERIWRVRFPGRDSDTCQECHESPHEDTFDQGGFAGAACLECHAPTAFKPATFPVALHERTGWPLLGSHQAVPCANCHDNQLTFDNPGTECVACHESPHSFQAADCQECHDTQNFRDTIVPFEHDRLTNFPLLGAHGEVDCRECHGSSTSRPPTACSACHGDPHAGQFRAYGEDTCSRCHSADDFNLTTFDHQTQSRFPLDGEHVNVPCESCHRPQLTRLGNEVIRYRPLPLKCEGCHEGGGG